MRSWRSQTDIYLSCHNAFRGFPKTVIAGNFFRSILSIPIAIVFNGVIAGLLSAAGVSGIDAVLQKWAAVISKAASDFVAGVIEGAADRYRNIHLRLRDYRDKLARLLEAYTSLELLFPDKKVMETLSAMDKSLSGDAKDLELIMIIHALDLLFFWNYQPRGRTALVMLARTLSDEERQILLGSLHILKRQREISMLFIDGIIGKNFSGGLAFYLNASGQYLVDVQKILGGPAKQIGVSSPGGIEMNLTVSIAQMRVAVSQPEENLRKAEVWIAEASRRGSDVICFPEMWTTGFNWLNNERLAASHDKIVDRVAEMARSYGIWINGSMLALNEAEKSPIPHFCSIQRASRQDVYRKTHLFSLLHEDAHMAPGEHLTVVDTPWGRVGLAICYDIRFPELFRTYALKGVEIVFCPMAFPYPRLDHWKILVRARAIENQMFVVGINQVGSEDFGSDGVVTYFGDSVIIDPWGRTVIEAGETDEMLLTATVNMDRVKEIRANMTVLKDRRPDLYELG